MMKVSWNKDMVARTRVEKQLVNGRLNGRHLIERDTRLSGGIYLSEMERLAITVDNNTPNISTLYRKVIGEAERYGALDRVSDRIFVRLAFESTKDAIKTDPFGLLDVIKSFWTASDMGISLDDLINMQIGDCRVFALTCATLVERLIDEGFVRGKISIDRNAIEDKGGHVWARFTNHMGLVTILDATLDHFGPEDGGRWVYKRD